MDLLVSRSNNKLVRFVPEFRDPLAIGSDSLITPWNLFNLIHALPSVKLLPHLLLRIKNEGIRVLLAAKNVLRLMW